MDWALTQKFYQWGANKGKHCSLYCLWEETRNGYLIKYHIFVYLSNINLREWKVIGVCNEQTKYLPKTQPGGANLLFLLVHQRQDLSDLWLVLSVLILLIVFVEFTERARIQKILSMKTYSYFLQKTRLVLGSQ